MAQTNVTILILIDGFLQSHLSLLAQHDLLSHNPYFNRWFSAISINRGETMFNFEVTILILIDGFLQFFFGGEKICMMPVTILILIDGFLQ